MFHCFTISTLFVYWEKTLLGNKNLRKLLSSPAKFNWCSNGVECALHKIRYRHAKTLDCVNWNGHLNFETNFSINTMFKTYKFDSRWYAINKTCYKKLKENSNFVYQYLSVFLQKYFDLNYINYPNLAKEDISLIKQLCKSKH